MPFLLLLRRAALAVFMAAILTTAANAQDTQAGGTTDPSPVEVAFGAYVLNISKVSLQDGSLAVDMWVWFRWKDADIRPDLMFEITNGTISSRSESDVYDDGEFKRVSVRVQASILHQFDVSRFPLDDHIIDIQFEDSSANSTELTFVLDEGAAIDQGVKVAGWTVALHQIVIAPYIYQSNYGYADAPPT